MDVPCSGQQILIITKNILVYLDKFILYSMKDYITKQLINYFISFFL